jgi:hypothetical protein
MAELYLHSLICFQGVVLKYLIAETNLPYQNLISLGVRIDTDLKEETCGPCPLEKIMGWGRVRANRKAGQKDGDSHRDFSPNSHR